MFLDNKIYLHLRSSGMLRGVDSKTQSKTAKISFTPRRTPGVNKIYCLKIYYVVDCACLFIYVYFHLCWPR